jgi:hypothetical protein
MDSARWKFARYARISASFASRLTAAQKTQSGRRAN